VGIAVCVSDKVSDFDNVLTVHVSKIGNAQTNALNKIHLIKTSTCLSTKVHVQGIT
jgi:hypothetical protein